MQTSLPKLSPLVDVVFRRLFEDPRRLCTLLNALLHLPPGRRLADLKPSPTQVLGPLVDDKEVVLDLRAQSEDGRHLHVEVQIRAYASYPERMLYYWAGMYRGQLERGGSYRELEPAISVHILSFQLLHGPEHGHYHHIFELLERRTGHRLSEHLQIHTVEMLKFAPAPGQLCTEEEKWLYFLQHGDEMSAEQVKKLDLQAIMEAEEALERISQDRSLRVLYEQRRKAKMDADSWEKDKKAQWQEEGKKLGLDEGKKLGLDEGKKLGLDEGLQRTVLDMCELLEIEVTPERRAHIQRLDTAGLEDLRKQIKKLRTWPA